ncbi:hypothetical protein BD410DRAFT_892572 [Rickenella mellea]|uniref:Mid2 domain-containing protein n=1 Tax=Rickenella mellea TaxID=50990 RepID=A0A4R5XF95_9AGAM|nr:hypothetical protein BD410DRAFT_892572 [Rickenella mellea]
MHWRALYASCLFFVLLRYAAAQIPSAPSPTPSPVPSPVLVSDFVTTPRPSRTADRDDASEKEAPSTKNTSSHSVSHSHSHSLSHSRTGFRPPSTTPPFHFPNPANAPPAHTHHIPPSPTPTSTRHGISPAGILFSAIGGVVGLAVVLALLRCLYKYKRTPHRDRIAALLDRHRLDRELREMEEERITGHRPGVIVPPPPPYICAPNYDEAIASSHSNTNSFSGEQDPFASNDDRLSNHDREHV